VVRVGVLGCGYWGSKHTRVLQGLPQVAEVSVIDASPERLALVRRDYPALRTFRSLDAAMDHVDAVVVATPPRSHAPLALELLEAGKHVLVEKPMATSVADAERMIAAAERAGRVLMVGHTFEFHSAVWRLKEAISSGELGDVYYVDTARLNLGLYQSDVNVLWDLAPHDISILNHILGSAPTAVQAWGARHAHAVLEDVAYLRLHYADVGVTTQVHVSWLDPCKVRRVTVVGSKRMAVYNDLAAEERIRIYDKGVSFAEAEAGPAMPMSYRYGGISSPYIALTEPLRLEDEHFVGCIVHGRRPATDGANGLAVVSVLEAAQRSLAEGRPIELAPIGPTSGVAA
jgi:predicted dehydrogenase